MNKKLFFAAALTAAAALSAQADEQLIYYTGFSDWTKTNAAESVVVEQQTDFTKEDFTFTMFQTTVNPTGTTDNGTMAPIEGMTVGTLMAEKNLGGTITLSALHKITRLNYIHAATGNNRGWGLKASVDGGTTWDVIYDTAIASSARSGVKVELDVVAKLAALGKAEGDAGVMFQFYNLNISQNAYLQDLWIYGEYTSTAPQVTLTTAMNMEGAGTITVTPPSASYDINTEVTLSAEPNFGYDFVNWTDAATGDELSTELSFSLVLDADKSVIANFSKKTLYQVVVTTSSRNGRYTISPEPTDGYLPEGTEVTLTAVDTRVSSFTGWDDGTTTKERKVTLTGDLEAVANFVDEDFIVGWNFDPQPADRSCATANFYSAVANQGALRLHKPDGTNINFLNNNRGGKKCVLKWTTDIANENRYFEATFSTKGYKDIKIESYALMGIYSFYDTQALQYSVDGETFTELASATYGGSEAWFPLNGNLPEECNDVEKVYLRWVSSGTIQGSGNDGSGIADIYVMATTIVEEDPIAPALVSTTPADGSTTVSASGTITFTFDKKIQLVEGKEVVLNGEVLTPRVVANSLIFNYSGLDYATPYSITLPAGIVTNASGVATTEDITLSFTVMTRPVPEARVYNAIVDQSLAATIPATDEAIGQYKTIWEAVEAAPADRTEPWLIFIKSGYYNDENGDAFVKGEMAKQNKEYYNNNGTQTSTETSTPGNILYIYKPFIHLIGQDKATVTIAQDRVCGSDRNNPDKHWYDVSNGATLVVQANDFYAENITIDNEWWTKNAAEGPQALALYVEGDRVAFNNCDIRSYQDTYLSPKTRNTNNANTQAAGATVRHYRDRNYFKNCMIEGAVDFIYGGGDVYFEGCTLNIVRASGGYIVAPCHYGDLTDVTGESDCTRWGYVFKNTRITAPVASQVWFGRPWHNSPVTVFIDTECDNVLPYDGIWYETMGAIPELWAVYNIYTSEGEALSTVSREDYYYMENGVKVEGKAKNYLTDEEAAQYTLENVLAGDGSDNRAVGKWNPAPMVEKTATPVINSISVNSENLLAASWTGDEYAICYVVKVGDKVIDITTETTIEHTIDVASYGKSFSVQSVNEYGALSEAAIEASIYPTALNEEKVANITVFAADGKINVRGITGDVSVIVYDLLGRVVNTIECNRNVSFDMPAGNYVVKVADTVTKIVVY